MKPTTSSAPCPFEEQTKRKTVYIPDSIPLLLHPVLFSTSDSFPPPYQHRAVPFSKHNGILNIRIFTRGVLAHTCYAWRFI